MKWKKILPFAIIYLSTYLGVRMDQAKYCFALTQEKIYDFLWLGLVTILPKNLAFATRLFQQDSLKKLSFKRVSLASLKLQCNFFTALISGLKLVFAKLLQNN